MSSTGTAGSDPELPVRAGISLPGEPAVTGYGRLPPGTACVADVWWSCCQERQRREGSFDEPEDRLNFIVAFML